MPIHSRLVAAGFRDYIDARRAAGDVWAFPELPHDAADEQASSRNFTRWWGLWCAANANERGRGFDHPRKRFHSFRHAFITACRGVIDEELRDCIVGHAGAPGQEGRRYGTSEIRMLSAQLEKVTFPTFPLPK